MTEIMMERWLKAINNIPEVDRVDVHNENPRVNQNAAERKSSDKVRQVEPEYTQTSYNSMLQIERNAKSGNYLQIQDANVVQKGSEDQQGHTESQSKLANGQPVKHVTLSSRSYGIQRIFFLHEQK